MQFLLTVTDKQPFQDHLPRKPFLGKTLLLWWDLSPRRLEWMCRGFHVCPLQKNLPISLSYWLWTLPPERHEQMYGGFTVSPMNSFFRTIFWVKFYWLNELCLPGYLNECAEASLYDLYKTIFRVCISYWVDQLFFRHTWTNVLNLPQYHWEMTTSRPPCH